MSSEIAIDGMGLVGAFGTGKEAFRSAMAKGRCEAQMLAVGPENDPGSDDKEENLYPALRAELEGLEEFISLRALRRMDYFSRLAILGVGKALLDANLMDADRQKMGIVIGTGYGASATTFGFMDTMLDFGDACASPTKFSNSVHNAAAANVAITLKIQGVNLTVSQFELSVPIALQAAMDWLKNGAADTIIMGGVEEYCRPLGYCYQRLFGLHDGPMEPLAFSQQTAIPGEGAAFLVLRRLEQCKQPLAVIDSLKLGQGRAEIPQHGKLIIGADGHNQSAKHYADSINQHQTSCFSPVYGSMPAGAAFDMAAAAIQLADSAGPIHCLKYNCRGDYAITTLSREGIS